MSGTSESEPGNNTQLNRPGSSTSNQRIGRRLLASVVTLLLLVCQGCQQSCQLAPGGTLQIITTTTGNVDFSALIASDAAAYNQLQLNIAPQLSFQEGAEVSYTDQIPTSTTDAQKETVVMARDLDEYESTLESINTEDNCQWLSTTFAPSQGPDPNCALGPAVGLPDGVGIPYPIDNNNRTLGGLTQLSLAQFTGSPNTGLAPPDDTPGGGSTKGLYLYRHGVCSAMVDAETSVLQPIVQQGPDGLANGIESNIPSPASGTANIEAFNLAQFVQRVNTDTLTGGFVQQVTVRVNWSFPPFLNDAVVARNYTYTYGLNNGILSVSPTKNPGGWDTGAFSGTIADGIDGSFPQQLSAGLYLGALSQQAQPIPVLNSPDPACSGNAAQKPADCFQACKNVPANYPAPLSPSNTDDSAWYDMNFCSGVATLVLSEGVNLGASAIGITDPQQLQQLSNALVGPNPNDSTKLSNIRCNFHPSYVIGSDGTHTPVCEVVARAKRINILPDQIELIWFDNPSLNQVASGELSNEAYSLFLVLKSQNQQGQLCQRTPNLQSGGTRRAFAHDSLY
jgi:hypothetical protein